MPRPTRPPLRRLLTGRCTSTSPPHGRRARFGVDNLVIAHRPRSTACARGAPTSAPPASRLLPPSAGARGDGQHLLAIMWKKWKTSSGSSTATSTPDSRVSSGTGARRRARRARQLRAARAPTAIGLLRNRPHANIPPTRNCNGRGVSFSPLGLGLADARASLCFRV